MKVITVLTVFLLCNSWVTLAQLSVISAYCDNRENPVGIHTKALSFSWELGSTLNNTTQTSYQLVISSDEDLLKQEIFDVFNSGKVRSSNNIQVAYCGEPLKPGCIYYWKVRAWDNHKQVSLWSDIQKFTTGLFNPADWKHARWIGMEDAPADTRVVPFVHYRMKERDPRIVKNAASPLLRKSFFITRKIKSALLFISGLGHYEAFVNGEKVSDAFLTPGWTFYDKTVLYNTYDVSPLLHDGDNAIGVQLGSGFYHVSQERYVKGTGSFGSPKMISLLKIEFADGSVNYIVSDSSWKTHGSATTFNNIYGGEDFDARLHQAGWNAAGFEDASWKPAIQTSIPTGILKPEMDYPVKFMDTFLVKAKRQIDRNITVYDFGQNVSGVPKIKVKGKPGQKIKIIPAELLHVDGRVNQYDKIAPYYYQYTIGSYEEEVWQPSFTYFAVRYVQIEDASDDQQDFLPLITDVTLLHNRNSSPSNGSFSCSNDLFNRIYKLIDPAIKSNLQSYITDNPQREKLSWQGEQNFMRVAINYNYRVYNLYRSLIRNMADAQHDNGLMPDIAPEYIQFEGPFVDSPEWGTTAILDSWFLYKYYGDTSIIRETFEMMTRYAAYLQKKSENNLLLYGLGDWLDIGGVTPLGITATAYYYHAITSLSHMASIIGKQSDAAHYHQLSENIKQAFNKKYFNDSLKVYATGSQTAMAMPLCFGMVENKNKAEVIEKFIEHIQKVDSNRITAGDVGHRYLVKALFENGRGDVLFDITNRDDVPGYGYILKKGATALTEAWDGKFSQNQLAMGHILEWFYEGISGITQAENSVAFRHIVIRPEPVGDITWAKGSFHSPYGWIRSNWELNHEEFSSYIEIPVNTKATVILPAKKDAEVWLNGKKVKNTRWEKNTISLSIHSGKHTIRIK